MIIWWSKPYKCFMSNLSPRNMIFYILCCFFARNVCNASISDITRIQGYNDTTILLIRAVSIWSYYDRSPTNVLCRIYLQERWYFSSSQNFEILTKSRYWNWCRFLAPLSNTFVLQHLSDILRCFFARNICNTSISDITRIEGYNDITILLIRAVSIWSYDDRSHTHILCRIYSQEIWYFSS